MQTEATPAQADVSELDLVKRCQAGDTEAFDELVTRYRTRIFGMIYNMVHNEQDAWDLTQDSFVKAWKSIKRFRGRSSFYTWIYRIVMNVTIDWLRKKQVRGVGAEFDDAIQAKQIDPASRTAPKADALPYEIMQRSETRTRIDNAIAQLSPEHRAVILMKEIEEMQYHEIAEKWTAWLDGQLTGKELIEFEASLPDKAAAKLEKLEAKKLGALLKRELGAQMMANEEFFSHQLRERIARENVEPFREQAADVSTWWTIRRLFWTGTASLALFLVFAVFVMREKNPAEQSQYLSQILNARVDPVVSPNATISMFEAKGDRVTVLWTEGLQSLPADYAAKYPL